MWCSCYCAIAPPVGREQRESMLLDGRIPVFSVEGGREKKKGLCFMFQKHICLTLCEITHYEFDNDV